MARSRRQTPLDAGEAVCEGIEHALGRAGGAREVERVGDDGARGGEIPRAVLVELRELLPWPGIEQLALPRGIPQRARRRPARRALLPPRQAQPYPVRHLAGESCLERNA